MAQPASAIDLGYRARSWQAECHRRRNRFSVLAVHRRAGKTKWAVMELVDHALRFDREAGLFIYLAPFLKQSKRIAWGEIKRTLRPLMAIGAVEVLEGELIVRFKHNGAELHLYGADNPDAMRGLRIDGIVIDEVAQVKPEVWDEIVRPALSDRKGWALFIGTPKGVNLFSELYDRGQRGAPGWFAKSFTVYDTHAVDAEEVELVRAEMSENAFAREYLCDFSAQSEDQLLSVSDIIAAQQRTLAPGHDKRPSTVIGVDPARFGDDRSVIFKRQGLMAHEPLVFGDIDNMSLASRLVREAREFGANAIFVDAGHGAGVIDRARQLQPPCPVIEVPFGGRALKPEYFNRRAEIWFEMAEWVRFGGVLPPSADLRRDLAAPIYSFTADDRYKLESKDDIKKRGLPSPDLGDALALTFAAPIGPPTELHQIAFARADQTHEYDPRDAL